MTGTTYDTPTVRAAVYALAETLWERLAVSRLDTRVDRYGPPGVAVQLVQHPTRGEAVDLVAGLGGVAIREVEFRVGGSAAWADITVTWHGQTLILTVFHTGDDTDDSIGGGRRCGNRPGS